MKKTNFVALIIFAALGLLLASCSTAKAASTATPQADPTQNAGNSVSAEGRLEPMRYVNLTLNTSGVVSEVPVKEGEEVKAGQLIARLENSQPKSLESAQADALSTLTDAYQAVRDAQYKLDQYQVPSDFAGMSAQQAVDNTLQKLNAARDAFAPYQWMSDKQLQLTQAEKDNNSVITSTPKRLKKALDDAWDKYRQAVDWLDRESSLQTAQAQLAQAQADYNGLQDSSFAENTAGARAALANTELRAPFAGTVTNLNLKVGEFAAPSPAQANGASATPAPSDASAVTVADFSSWVVKTTDLTEIDVVHVKPGQPVTLTLDALPGKVLNGYVYAIAQNYGTREGDIIYQVTVRLSDALPQMRWGMTAQVKFPK